jgi:hypothetical protein
MISLLIEDLYWKELANALERLRFPGLEDLAEDTWINTNISTSISTILSLDHEA